jgi:hypothetical protein
MSSYCFCSFLKPYVNKHLEAELEHLRQQLRQYRQKLYEYKTRLSYMEEEKKNLHLQQEVSVLSPNNMMAGDGFPGLQALCMSFKSAIQGDREDVRYSTSSIVPCCTLFNTVRPGPCTDAHTKI